MKISFPDLQRVSCLLEIRKIIYEGQFQKIPLSESASYCRRFERDWRSRSRVASNISQVFHCFRKLNQKSFILFVFKTWLKNPYSMLYWPQRHRESNRAYENIRRIYKKKSARYVHRILYICSKNLNLIQQVSKEKFSIKFI